MSVEEKHPDYADRITEWDLMRDTFHGSTRIKQQNDVYLPMPEGFTAQEDKGTQMYSDYITRAQFPEIVFPTAQGIVGIISRIEPKIELPAALESMTEKATKDGQPIEELYRQIVIETTLQGRYSLLVDAPEEGADVPYIVGHRAESLINWSKERDFFVIDESRLVRNEFTWRNEERYRVLQLDGGRYSQREYIGANSDGQDIDISARGAKPLNEIPLVVIGSTKLMVHPDQIPLWGLANSALAMYRLDADYRHQLYRSGQETLFCFGLTQDQLPKVIGAGVVVGMPAGEGVEAKYVGPEGVGIEAHERAIAAEQQKAVAYGARLFDQASRTAESGDALRLRYGAQTATLLSIALATASGLEKALRYAARFVGAPEEQVVVKPNLSFLDVELDPADVVSLVTAWQASAYSYQTLYDNLQRGGIASQERTADEEQALIETENPLGPPTDPISGLPLNPGDTGGTLLPSRQQNSGPAKGGQLPPNSRGKGGRGGNLRNGR